MLNEMIVVAVTSYSGTDSNDKNGNSPVMLQLIAGKMPNRNVLSGTLAIRAGIEIGKTYLMNVREQGTDKQFGLDYTFTKIQELTSGLDIIRASKELGEARIIAISRPQGYEDSYERKSNAIEGLRTKRIKEGSYIPSSYTNSVDHTTAKEVLAGTSQDTRDTQSKEIDGILEGNNKKSEIHN